MTHDFHHAFRPSGNESASLLLAQIDAPSSRMRLASFIGLATFSTFFSHVWIAFVFQIAGRAFIATRVRAMLPSSKRSRARPSGEGSGFETFSDSTLFGGLQAPELP